MEAVVFHIVCFSCDSLFHDADFFSALLFAHHFSNLCHPFTFRRGCWSLRALSLSSLPITLDVQHANAILLKCILQSALTKIGLPIVDA